MRHFVFWQPIPSFHQEGFLVALAQADWVASVTLKYETELPENRRQSGWRDGLFPGVALEPIRAGECPNESAAHVHFFTGFLTHREIWNSFKRISLRAPCHCYAFAEAPECVGWKGILRKVKYRINARRIAPRLDGMLALGQLGVDFYRGILPSSIGVYEFAYYDVRESEIHELDLQCDDSQQSASRHYRFLYVGQLIHRKGVDRLLRALASVSLEEWTLTLVGEGCDQQRLQALASTLGISDKIEWCGSLPSSELYAYYQRADCLVLPSRWDGWGMTVNEALRCGCAVLVSPSCGAASILQRSSQLPVEVEKWPELLEAHICGGTISAVARGANVQIAKSLSGEAGVARLKSVLCN
ncbi:glycosyltransferase [Coraliomargarita algicola]|uniref:Glycosyltransferase n=1 Tax=Coraliomargarita algicola TaxID=3092156 RepID=A0ABZ0RII7_9BACT|nr:glycosyltransferase [Coraliomargarita sp. J2-16]WPJ94986.1 glycosyltransferase [Coraliomargarita sp. J2-16]